MDKKFLPKTLADGTLVYARTIAMKIQKIQNTILFE
jgi:hypothetical protein